MRSPWQLEEPLAAGGAPGSLRSPWQLEEPLAVDRCVRFGCNWDMCSRDVERSKARVNTGRHGIGSTELEMTRWRTQGQEQDRWRTAGNKDGSRTGKIKDRSKRIEKLKGK